MCAGVCVFVFILCGCWLLIFEQTRVRWKFWYLAMQAARRGGNVTRKFMIYFGKIDADICLILFKPDLNGKF